MQDAEARAGLLPTTIPVEEEATGSQTYGDSAPPQAQGRGLQSGQSMGDVPRFIPDPRAPRRDQGGGRNAHGLDLAAAPALRPLGRWGQGREDQRCAVARLASHHPLQAPAEEEVESHAKTKDEGAQDSEQAPTAFEDVWHGLNLAWD